MNKSLKDYYFRCAPYGFKKMSDGRYLGLNRDHLPLDRSRKEVGDLNQLDYDNFLENAHKEIGISLSIKDIELIKHTGNEDMFWLYEDGSAPWNGTKYQAAYDKKIDKVPAVKWVS